MAPRLRASVLPVLRPLLPSAGSASPLGPGCRPYRPSRQTSPDKSGALRLTQPPYLRPRRLIATGFALSCRLAPARPPHLRFVSLGPRLWPPASFRSRLAAGTLAFGLRLPRSGPAGDFHPQVTRPCWAYRKRAPAPSRAGARSAGRRSERTASGRPAAIHGSGARSPTPPSVARLAPSWRLATQLRLRRSRGSGSRHPDPTDRRTWRRTPWAGPASSRCLRTAHRGTRPPPRRAPRAPAP